MLRSPLLLLMAALSHAPLQCTGDPAPGMSREERPGEALYQLAVKFKRQGDEDAWRTTLVHLIHRYPSSRFAVTAEQDLEAAGIEIGAAEEGTATEGEGATAAAP